MSILAGILVSLVSGSIFCVRPSATPEHALHIMLDYPRIISDIFGSADSTGFVPGNLSDKLSLEKSLRAKGFTSDNCFLFYCFPRPCSFTPTEVSSSPRDKYPALRISHDKLHAYWRSRGGKIVIIMGNNAMKAYTDMVRRDNVLKEEISSVEAYDVYVERSRVYLPLVRSAKFRLRMRSEGL